MKSRGLQLSDGKVWHTCIRSPKQPLRSLDIGDGLHSRDFYNAKTALCALIRLVLTILSSNEIQDSWQPFIWHLVPRKWRLHHIFGALHQPVLWHHHYNNLDKLVWRYKHAFVCSCGIHKATLSYKPCCSEHLTLDTHMRTQLDESNGTLPEHVSMCKHLWHLPQGLCR